MSVLINGVEMPESCEGCNFYDYEQSNCLATKDMKNTLPHNRPRPEWCPLIPIPPHGRLIDADALLADVRVHSESYFADDFAHEWVDVAPTIIPADPDKEGEG